MSRRTHPVPPTPAVAMIQTLSFLPTADAHAVRYGACLALGVILGLGLSLASVLV